MVFIHISLYHMAISKCVYVYLYPYIYNFNNDIIMLNFVYLNYIFILFKLYLNYIDKYIIFLHLFTETHVKYYV